MSETTKYKPPKTSWRLPVLIEAPIKKVKKTVVDCSTCPVSLLCENREGGSGYVCDTCGGTAVLVEEPQDNKAPDDVLLIDCEKHKFEKREGVDPITRCTLCSGAIMETEVQGVGVRHHLVLTAHSRVKIEDRIKQLSDAAAYWHKMLEKAKTAEK